MRILLRVLFLLMLLSGILLGIALPKAVQHVPGYEIGRWQVYGPEAGFSPAEVMLSPPDAPIFITVVLRTGAPLRSGAARAVMVLTMTSAGDDTLIERELSFPGAAARESPQSDVFVHRETLSYEEPLDGAYVFDFAPGDDMEPSILSAELLLNAGAYDLDPRMEPAGYLLLVLGAVGFLMTLRRGKPKAPPPPPRWGRGGGEA